MLGFTLRRVQSKWKYKTIDNARRAWTRLELWLQDEGIHHEDGAVDAMTLNEYFLYCHNASIDRSDRAWAAKMADWEKAVAEAKRVGKE